MAIDSVNINNKAEKQNTYDAIVIGSGISGGWAAKELTEKGLKVLMLERGKNVEHIKDYTTAQKDPWEFEHRGATTSEQKEKYPVVHRGWAAQEAVMGSWTNEQDCPYTEVKPFTWWRSYQMGGRSLLWGRQSYRWSDLDFEANAKEGVGVDWPVASSCGEKGRERKQHRRLATIEREVQFSIKFWVIRKVVNRRWNHIVFHRHNTCHCFNCPCST